MTPDTHHVSSAALAPDLGPYVVRLTFGDGHRSNVDLGPWLTSNASHPIFGRYLDPDAFGSFTVEDGELSWGDGELEFHPEALRANEVGHEVAGT